MGNLQESFCDWSISTTSIRGPNILASQARNHTVLYGKEGKRQGEGKRVLFVCFFSEEIEKAKRCYQVILLIFISVIKQWAFEAFLFYQNLSMTVFAFPKEFIVPVQFPLMQNMSVSVGNDPTTPTL